MRIFMERVAMYQRNHTCLLCKVMLLVMMVLIVRLRIIAMESVTQRSSKVLQFLSRAISLTTLVSNRIKLTVPPLL